MRKKKPVQRVFFEVLQNGEYLDDASRPYGKNARIILSSRKGALVLPFYPLSHDIELARIEKKGVKVFLDSSWSGFITSAGQAIRLTPTGGENQVYHLGPGDYGALSKFDLKVLLKIGPEKQEVKVPHSRAYRGKWLALFISPLEAKILALATLVSMIIFGSFIGGLLRRPDDRPRSKDALNPEYNIAFVNPDHIRNLPEALQSNIDRAHPLASAMKYYKAISETFIGYPAKDRRYIFPSTSQLYENLYKAHHREIDSLVEAQTDINRNIMANKKAAIMTIPSVKGETLGGSMIRLESKMKSLHHTFEESLEVRRKTTKIFLEDHSYDFDEYSQKGAKNKGDSAISAIRAFTLMTNEATMYKEAEDLALLAEIEQARIKSHSEPNITIKPSNSEPIGIEPKVTYLSFIPDEHYADNHKLSYITASTFGEQEKKGIVEPLIGQINPKLIEQVIDKNRFQLQLCFELALRRNRNLSGKMEWTWRLDSRGKLSDLVLKTSTIEDRSMRRCIQQKIAKWQFPRPNRGSIEVTYPFIFGPTRG